LFVFECVSALRRMVVRKDLDGEPARSAMGLLGTMPVSLRAPQGLVERAWAIATELDRPTAYDSFYLGLAEVLGIECWTADRRLFNAAHEKKPWLHHLGEHRPSSTTRA
jgi:predicted nucleic acid-binding protein